MIGSPLQVRARVTSSSFSAEPTQHIRCASTHRYRGPYVVMWMLCFLFVIGGVMVVLRVGGRDED